MEGSKWFLLSVGFMFGGAVAIGMYAHSYPLGLGILLLGEGLVLGMKAAVTPEW